MGSSDETAAALDATARPTATPDVGKRLGRYIIERQLGAGGMGVVHAALDTELERHVALKVLRGNLQTDAQARLLREARAMARLAHPNVITVYEVDSADGRDFIAMELIDGESLVDWLQGGRVEADIIAAFHAAGIGLAAAHEAGIVHRDFKPHNVLRSRAGRIAVGDFGIARELAPRAASATRGAVGELTEPGSLLGTPAYMAPEQWRGDAVTPATDQFAFCVALWEALAGERPYPATTIETLRAQVLGGPAALTGAKLPRRLRAVLRRGLDPDPAKRWPALTELLAQLPARRRRGAIAVALVGLVAAGGVIAVVATRSTNDGAATPAGDPCATRVDTTDLRAARLDADASKLVGDTVASWQTARTAACDAHTSSLAMTLECLDRVLARTRAAVRAKQLEPRLPLWDRLVDPARCERSPPSLPASYSDAAIAALALLPDEPDEAKIERVRAAAAGDPCASAYVAIALANRTDPARDAGERCDDDTAKGWLAVIRVGLGGIAPPERLREVERLVDRIDHAPLRRDFHVVAGWSARAARNYDDALAHLDAALALARDPHDLAIARLDLLVGRAGPGDFAGLRVALAGARAASRDREYLWRLDWLDATVAWWQGDVATAHARLVELHRANPAQLDPGERITGVVVDAAGAPVAGAIVASGRQILGDAAGIATPLRHPKADTRSVELATTAADGSFTLAHALVGDGVMIAQLGEFRSAPAIAAPNTKLVLAPTTRLGGRIELGGRPGRFAISAFAQQQPAVTIEAPVMANGAFELAGLPRGKLTLVVSQPEPDLVMQTFSRELELAAPRTGYVIDLPAVRSLQVLVRSTTGKPIGSAMTHVVAGAFTGSSLADIERLARRSAVTLVYAVPFAGAPPLELASQYRAGDAYVRVDSAPVGVATVCAVPMSVDGTDILGLRCQPVPANATLVVVEVPPGQP